MKPSKRHSWGEWKASGRNLRANRLYSEGEVTIFMKYQGKNMDSDWAKEVPDVRFRGPYNDFGWEPGESVLPEFRDPSVHLNPDELREARTWRQQQNQGRRMRNRGQEGRMLGPRNYYSRNQMGRGSYGRMQTVGETNRYGRREIPDDERDQYGWSQYYGEPFSRGIGNYERGGQEDIYYGERESWMSQGPFTGVGPAGYQRSDEQIKDEVCDRLTRHGQIDARKIQIDVSDGDVTLRGAVPSRHMKRMAEDSIESVPGVQDINNELTIQKNQEMETSRSRMRHE